MTFEGLMETACREGGGFRPKLPPGHQWFSSDGGPVVEQLAGGGGGEIPAIPKAATAALLAEVAAAAALSSSSSPIGGIGFSGSAAILDISNGVQIKSSNLK